MKKLLYLFLVLGLFACSSDSADEDNEPCPSQPELTTNEVTNINYDQNNDYFTATLSGEISNIPLGANCETLSVTNQGFVYDTNIQPTIEDNVANANGQNASTNIVGLISETTYYVRAYLTNTLGTFYGNQVIFETSETPDLVAPVITIIGDNPMLIINYEEYEELGATAIDNVDGDITNAIEISSNVDTQVEGTYEVIYSVSDSWGNTASETRIVEVYGSPVYLAENGVTVKAHDWAEIGMVGYLNGKNYTIVDELNDGLDTWLSDVERVCTTRVVSLQGALSHYSVGSFCWNEISIRDWDVSNVTSMSNLFEGVNAIVPSNSCGAPDLSYWDTSNVMFMGAMFRDVNYLEIPGLSEWDVGNVQVMSSMFENTNDIINSISEWDVGNVYNMAHMFKTSGFNQDLSSWNVENVSSCYDFCLNAYNWTLPKPDFTNCSQDLGCD